MSLIPILTLTELRLVSMEHLQRVWHAGRERISFRIHSSVPLLGMSLCSNCWDQCSQTCSFFSRLFTWYTPRYFLEFAFVIFPLRFWRLVFQSCHIFFRIFTLNTPRYFLEFPARFCYRTESDLLRFVFANGQSRGQSSFYALVLCFLNGLSLTYNIVWEAKEKYRGVF